MCLLNLCKTSHHIVLCCRNRLMMQSSRQCHQRIQRISPHCHRQYSSPQEGEVGYLPNRCLRRMPPAMWKRYLNFMCSTEAKENMLQHPADWTSEIWALCIYVENRNCKDPRLRVVRTTAFYTVAPNIFVGPQHGTYVLSPYWYPQI